MIERVIVQLVDDNKRTVDYDIIGIINDYSKSPKCPRISKTTTLPFSIEDIQDPLWEPAFDVKEKTHSEDIHANNVQSILETVNSMRQKVVNILLDALLIREM